MSNMTQIVRKLEEIAQALDEYEYAHTKLKILRAELAAILDETPGEEPATKDEDG